MEFLYIVLYAIYLLCCQVEGGRIDHGQHDSKPRRAVEELLALDDTVKRTLEMVDTEETLIVVTADHSHVMTINGYPDRGNNILGNYFSALLVKYINLQSFEKLL